MKNCPACNSEMVWIVNGASARLQYHFCRACKKTLDEFTTLNCSPTESERFSSKDPNPQTMPRNHETTLTKDKFGKLFEAIKGPDDNDAQPFRIPDLRGKFPDEGKLVRAPHYHAQAQVSNEWLKEVCETMENRAEEFKRQYLGEWPNIQPRCITTPLDFGTEGPSRCPGKLIVDATAGDTWSLGNGAWTWTAPSEGRYRLYYSHKQLLVTRIPRKDQRETMEKVSRLLKTRRGRTRLA